MERACANIIVYVEGGVIQGIRSTAPGISAEIVDYDDMKENEENYEAVRDAAEKAEAEQYPFEVL